MLILHSPITVIEIKSKNGLVGYKVEPWLKTTREDMFIINLDDVLTISESSDVQMIMMYQNFLRDSERDNKNQSNNSKDKFINITNAYKIILESLTKPSKT